MNRASCNDWARLEWQRIKWSFVSNLGKVSNRERKVTMGDRSNELEGKSKANVKEEEVAAVYDVELEYVPLYSIWLCPLSSRSSNLILLDLRLVKHFPLAVSSCLHHVLLCDVFSPSTAWGCSENECFLKFYWTCWLVVQGTQLWHTPITNEKLERSCRNIC